MMQKLFITEDNKATLVCPACDRNRSIDASAYITIERIVRIKIKCPCGHQYAAQLERRRYFRKTVHFPGTYSRAAGGCHAGRGTMDVLDLSRTGVKLRVGKHDNLKVGDRLTVEFQLDDRKRSRISRESVVRRIDGTHLGAEFTPSDPADPNHKAIGFYLFAA